MWLYVNLFRLCVCVYVGTYLVETMSWNEVYITLSRRIPPYVGNTAIN